MVVAVVGRVRRWSWEVRNREKPSVLGFEGNLSTLVEEESSIRGADCKQHQIISRKKKNK